MSFQKCITHLSALLFGCALLPVSSFAQLSFQNEPVAAGYVTLHGDFNGDGREDLVNGKTLLLSNGDGTYQAAIPLPASADAIGDFNHDGRLDFISYRTGGGAVNESATPTIYLGNGNGTFQAGKVVAGAGPVGLGDIFYLIVADLNHDNRTDFVTVEETYGNGNNGYPTPVHVWLSNGDGTFTKGQSFTTQDPDPTNPNTELGGVYTGDFDGDGKPDLAIIYQLFTGPGIVQIWYGDSAGHLGSPYYLTDPHGYYEGTLTVADVNNDGREDLISGAVSLPAGRYPSLQGYPKLAFFAGNANRTMSYSNISTSQCAGNPAVADFNGDGLNDLAYNVSDCSAYPGANESMAYVVRAGQGSGAFGPEATVAQSVTGGYSVSALRSTAGTKPDLVFNQVIPGSNNTGTTSTRLLINTSTGNFPGCGLSLIAEGLQICTPGSSATSPVKFSVGAAGPTPMRTAAVWVDGKKVAEQLTHAFSNYSFLDASLPLAAGSHAITVYGTGWDNTLQQKSFTLTVGSGGSCPFVGNGVNLCQPLNGSTVSSPVTVLASSNIPGTLARMEVWIDSVKKYTETNSATLTYTISLPPGSHRFAVFAVNTAGGKTETFGYATVK